MNIEDKLVFIGDWLDPDDLIESLDLSTSDLVELLREHIVENIQVFDDLFEEEEEDE